MADHAKPILTDNYTDVLSQIRGRFEDQAKGFDPANTTATNIATGTIRWNSAEKKFQKWSGTAWGDLSSLYAINISGNAATATNASTVTNGVYTVGDQTIAGVKTFSSTIQGSISGNAGTVTNGVYTAGDQTINGVKTFSSNTIFNGNLGVGTSSPAAKVHALTPSAAAVGFRAANSMSFAEFQVDASGNSQLIAPGGTQIFNTNGSERMRIDANGNLGIGTTNTSGYKLAVKSGTKTLYFTTDATTGFAYCDGNYYFGTTGADVVAVVTNNTERVRISANGNLLVGNTNGTSRITASGVIESTTGGFKFPDGTTQTTAASSGFYNATVSFDATGATVQPDGVFTYMGIGNFVSVTGRFLLAKTTSNAVDGNVAISIPTTRQTWQTVRGVATTPASTVVFATPEYFGIPLRATVDVVHPSTTAIHVRVSTASGYSGSVWAVDVSFMYAIA